ncbi:hypothetical protein H9649_12480 [Sporosarcina sp. Sa2YVA2]|uniref:Uncharacterized protein n=1 Tax=Sporosarcina quadrami TaxID=2762234 RepID=A0ABR8UCG9_9BACL|nr:hypothetical protein [Sporosarcina quadrami]MBD7985408.1 hypothetical protein [Sporosarcina quadrami]
MDTHSTQEALHKIIADFTKDLMTTATSDNTAEDSSKSYMYLDSKTINLLLLYVLMNKELQLTRLTKRNIPIDNVKELGDEIDKMIVENKRIFEELLNELKTNF